MKIKASTLSVIWIGNPNELSYSNLRIMEKVLLMACTTSQDKLLKKKHSRNRALNIPSLIESCYKRELELRNAIFATTSEKKRTGNYKRFFYQLPKTETDWKPFIILDYQGEFRFSSFPIFINPKNYQLNSGKMIWSKIKIFFWVILVLCSIFML